MFFYFTYYLSLQAAAITEEGRKQKKSPRLLQPLKRMLCKSINIYHKLDIQILKAPITECSLHFRCSRLLKDDNAKAERIKILIVENSNKFALTLYCD